MSNEIDFLLDEIRRECELGNIKGVIALSKRLEEITCSCIYEKNKDL